MINSIEQYNKNKITVLNTSEDYLLVNDINFALTRSSPFFYFDLLKLKIEKLLLKVPLSLSRYGVLNTNDANVILKKSKRLRKKMLLAKIALHFRKCIKIIYSNILDGMDEFQYIVGDSYNTDNEIITEALTKYFHNNDQLNTFLTVIQSQNSQSIGLWFKFQNLDL